MVRALARYGAYVREVETAAQALAAVESNGSVDVLVSDISMPGMTGIELAQTLRAQGNKVPILFVTGAELSGREHDAIAGLDVRVITKPFDMVDLARTVQSLMAGSTPS
jgi:CheY-like chemotaxis protein